MPPTPAEHRFRQRVRKALEQGKVYQARGSVNQTILQEMLSEHSDERSPRKRYACAHCDYRTDDRSNMVKHQRVHTGDRPHECRHGCGAGFRSTSNLYRHERICKLVAEADEGDDDMSTEAPASTHSSTEVPAPRAAQDLYIMTRSDAPGILKVGRSGNPTGRAEDLQRGQCFRVTVLATFPNAGDKENAVHRVLYSHRVTEGSGQEWFRVSISQALAAVSVVL